MQIQSDNQNPLTAKVVLGIGAHPDDLDGMAGGTIAKYVANGAEVYYLILTGGGKGSGEPDAKPDDLVNTREAEQRAAAQILGVRDVFFAGHSDGGLQCNDKVRRDIVKCIRHIKPDVVVTLDPTVVYDLEREVINHPDHRAAGQAALDAVYPFARDRLTYPELLDEGLEPHEVTSVLLFNYATPNCLVDISATIDKKCEALAAHRSQHLDSEEMQTVIRDLAKKAGSKAGCEYAEPFVCFDVHIG